MNNYSTILPKYPGLTKSQIEVWHILKNYDIDNDPDGWFNLSNEEAAMWLGINPYTVVRAIKKLSELGYVEVRYGKTIRDRWLRVKEGVHED